MLGWLPIEGTEELIEKTRDALVIDAVDLSRGHQVIPGRWKERVEAGGLTAVPDLLAPAPQSRRKKHAGSSKPQTWALIGSDLVDLNAVKRVKTLREKLLILGDHSHRPLLQFDLQDFIGEGQSSKQEAQERMELFADGIGDLISMHQQGFDLNERKGLLDTLDIQLL